MAQQGTLVRTTPGRFRVFDTYVHAVSRPEVSPILAEYLKDGKPHQVVTVNLDFLRIARERPDFAAVINSSDLSVPDGQPLAWIARYLGLRCDRITGPDVIDELSRLSVERGYGIYLLGGADNVAREAAAVLEARFPGIRIAGADSPPPADYPLPEALDSEIVARVKAAKPDILLVGFGCPKQDLWIRDHLSDLGVGVSVGVGGSFNLLSGHLRRAPGLLQRGGLEWVHRLLQEPGRLWRRYLLGDLPLALGLILREAASRARLSGTSALSREN